MFWVLFSKWILSQEGQGSRHHATMFVLVLAPCMSLVVIYSESSGVTLGLMEESFRREQRGWSFKSIS